MRTSLTIAMLVVCSVVSAQDQPPIPRGPVDPLATDGRLTLQSETCVISLPPETEPPPSQETGDGWAWVGSPRLAAHVPANGVWTGMGPKHNYRDKWWWWREGYRAAEENQPELRILATRLDASAPPVVIERATNAILTDVDLILAGMEFPTAGCWDVFVSYHGEELRFIFKVGA